MLQPRLQALTLLGRRHDVVKIPVRTSLYETYRKGPGQKYNPKFDWKMAIGKLFTKDSFRLALEDMKRLRDEWKHRPVKIIRPMVVDYHEHFDTEESFGRWKAISDSSQTDGYSTSKLERSKQGHALFTGVLDTRVPQDGLVMIAGFAGLVGPRKYKALNRQEYYDWSGYTHLKLRFRGDGRTYHVSINTSDDNDDMTWYDTFSYPLYTHGGPYWQEVSIPFVNFIHAYKGLAQDIQPGLRIKQIKFVSIILCDKVNGPFQLEMDYIGVYQDRGGPRSSDYPTPYESYAVPHMKLQPKQYSSK